METTIENINKPHSGRTTAGVIILIIGGLLLIDQFDLFTIPGWIFSWPMWLIAFGIYSGAKHNFRNRAWMVFILLGVGFLLENTGLVAGSILWPVGLITVGAYMIFRRSFQPESKEC